MAKIKRILNIVLDGCGVGNAPDAAKYDDVGANTLLHVIEKKNPDIPNLMDLGLGRILGLKTDDEPMGCYGRMQEKAAGKDTTSGHWEIAGLTQHTPFPTYPNGFPKEVIDAFERETGMQVIGNKPASGTEIIKELGDEHLVTGKLIVYTSADSVFQIAAHNDVVPEDELYHICREARKNVLVGEHAVGRVIARPFNGTSGNYVRTPGRRDFSLNPTGDTMLDVLRMNHFDVLSVGKIDDIFNHRGISVSDHAAGNNECIVSTIKALKKNWRGLCFVNMVDTDAQYGHRRDVDGFAECLETFDSYLPDMLGLLGEDGVIMITADHGCDPTFKGTDHTREEVPLLVWGLGIQEGVDLGTRKTFADVAKTTLDMLEVPNSLDGESFYDLIRMD